MKTFSQASGLRTLLRRKLSTRSRQVSHFMILNLFVAVIVENVTRASTTADVKFLQDLQKQKCARTTPQYTFPRARYSASSISKTL